MLPNDVTSTQGNNKTAAFFVSTQQSSEGRMAS